MKKKIKMYIERSYPYVYSFIVCIVIHHIKFNFLENENMNELIDGIVTLESIVIGLIGAIIPVVLSMKNESKFVRYVFEKDSKGLFRKYMTVTIGGGLLSITTSLLMFIRDEFSAKFLVNLYYIWIFLVILFLFSTYRSMKYMIALIFIPDEDIKPDISVDQTKREELRKAKQCK